MRPRLLLVSVVVLLAVLLVGCGADRLDPAELLANASSRTTDAGSSRVAIRMDVPGGAADGQPARITGDGVYDYRANKAVMTLEFPAGFPTADGASTVRVETRFDGGTMYQRLPDELTARLPEGKSWFKVDLAELGDDELGQQQALDPAQWLEFLRGVSDDIDTVGDEELRGTRTTHFRFTTNLRKAAEAAEVPDQRKAALEQLSEAIGSDTLPMDVWIDDDGRLRRLRYEADVTSPASGRMSMDVELWEFGVAVDVTPPPAEQVLDATELVGDATAGAGG